MRKTGTDVGEFGRTINELIRAEPRLTDRQSRVKEWRVLSHQRPCETSLLPDTFANR
jgi:hypothetical protein